MVDLDNPVSAAIEVRDQCVASLGARSKVATTTASTCSSVMLRGPPGRGSSTKPSSRRSINRRRHTPTVCGQTPTSAATCLLGLPAAQPNTIRHRCANACDDVGRRAQRSNVCRSSSVNTNAAFGLPRSAMNQVYNYLLNSWRRTLEGYGVIDAEQVRELADGATLRLVECPTVTPAEALRYQPS